MGESQRLLVILLSALPSLRGSHRRVVLDGLHELHFMPERDVEPWLISLVRSADTGERHRAGAEVAGAVAPTGVGLPLASDLSPTRPVQLERNDAISIRALLSSFGLDQELVSDTGTRRSTVDA